MRLVSTGNCHNGPEREVGLNDLSVCQVLVGLDIRDHSVNLWPPDAPLKSTHWGGVECQWGSGTMHPGELYPVTGGQTL